MKFYIQFIFSILLLSFCILSCSIPRYIVDNKTQRVGIDFSNGKWLLNEIDAPIEVKDELTQLAINDFTSFNNDVDYIFNVKGLLLSKKVSLSPTKLQLQDIKNGTGYDFLINVKAENIRSDYNTIDITPHKFDKGGKNQDSVIIEIYDLNNSEIIYSKKVTATATRIDDNSDVYLSKTSKSLIIGGYKKLIKSIREKSTFKKI